MKTYVIIIIVSVLVVSLGIALFFILSNGSSGSSSGGVKANAVGQRAQFTNIENFKSKEKFDYGSATTTPTTTAQLHSPEKIAKVNNIYKKLIKTLDVYKTAETLTPEQVTQVTTTYTGIKNMATGIPSPTNVRDDAYLDGFLEVFRALIKRTSEEEQNTAIGLMGDFLHFNFAPYGFFIMFFNSSGNHEYKMRLPTKICHIDAFSEVIHSDGIFTNLANSQIHPPQGSALWRAKSGSDDRKYKVIDWLDHKRFDKTKTEVTDGDICETTNYSIYLPGENEAAKDIDFNTNRKRKVGDSCELLRQNIWANTLGSWLHDAGGLGDTRNCNSFDLTDFINKIDTGDWEYSVSRQALINMFKRIPLGSEPNQTTQTI